MTIIVYKKGEDVQLSKHFHLKEWDCHCKRPECNTTPVDLDHIEKLEKLREDLNASITLNCAYRCPAHNKEVGGETNSLHMKGSACDIVVKGMSPDEVADACESFQGLGRYRNFTHIDSRNTTKKARWDFR